MQSHQVQPLLRSIFEDLPCKKLSIVNTKDGQVLCGFQSKCSMIIHDLTRLIKPLQVYKAGEENYIVVYSQLNVAAFIKTKFKGFIEKLLPDINGYYNDALGFVFSVKEDYDRFIESNEKVEAIRKVGIDYGWTEQTTIMPDPMWHIRDSPYDFFPMGNVPFQPGMQRKRDYWLDYCGDSKAIYRAIFPESKDLKQDRMIRQSLLQAEYSSESKVNQLINRNVQNKPVLNNIFSYLWKPIRKIEISVSKCEIENTDLKSNNYISKIEELIEKLEKETKDTINVDKSSKAAFLKLILNFKKANPLFALHGCLKLAEIRNPDLYKTAIKGTFSRTAKLLNEINKVPDKNKTFRVSL